MIKYIATIYLLLCINVFAFNFTEENKYELEPEYVISNLVAAINERCRTTLRAYPSIVTNCNNDTEYRYQYRVNPISEQSIHVAWHPDQVINKIVLFNGELKTNKYIKYKYEYPSVADGYVWIPTTQILYRSGSDINIARTNAPVMYYDISGDTNIYVDAHVLFEIVDGFSGDLDGARFTLNQKYYPCATNLIAFVEVGLFEQIIKKTFQLRPHFILTNSMINTDWPWYSWEIKNFIGITNFPDEREVVPISPIYESEWVELHDGIIRGDFPKLSINEIISGENTNYFATITNRLNLLTIPTNCTIPVEGWAVNEYTSRYVDVSQPFSFENSYGYQARINFLKKGIVDEPAQYLGTNDYYRMPTNRVPVADLRYRTTIVTNNGTVYKQYRPFITSYDIDINPPFAYTTNDFQFLYDYEKYSTGFNKIDFPEHFFEATLTTANIVTNYPGGEYLPDDRNPLLFYVHHTNGYSAFCTMEYPTNIQAYAGLTNKKLELSVTDNHIEFFFATNALWITFAFTNDVSFESILVNTNTMEWDPDYDPSVQFTIYRNGPHSNRYMQIDNFLNAEINYYDADIALAIWNTIKKYKQTPASIYAYKESGIINSNAYIGIQYADQSFSDPRTSTITNFYVSRVVTNVPQWTTSQASRAFTTGTNAFSFSITQLLQNEERRTPFVWQNGLEDERYVFTKRANRDASFSFDMIKDHNLSGRLGMVELIVDQSRGEDGRAVIVGLGPDISGCGNIIPIYDGDFRDIEFPENSVIENIKYFNATTGSIDVAVFHEVIDAEYTIDEYQSDDRIKITDCGFNQYAGSLVKIQNFRGYNQYAFFWDWDFVYE